MAKTYFTVMLFCVGILTSNAQFIDGMEWPQNNCPDHWVGWSGCPVVGPGGHSGLQGGFLGNEPASDDYLLNLDNRTTGEAGLEFYAFIPSNKEAYMNIQGEIPIGPGEWCLGNIFFNDALGNPGVGYVSNSNPPSDVNFNFPHDEWFRVVFNFDLTGGMAAATCSFSVNNEIVLTPGTPFKTVDGNTPTSLGGLNVYAVSTDASLYADDFNYIIDGQHELRLGLEDQLLATTKVYPNPVSDKLNIESKVAIDAVMVYDLKGTLMLQSQASDELNMSHLTTGMYFVEVRSKKTKTVKRVIKQ